jgi:TatD related DNase
MIARENASQRPMLIDTHCHLDFPDFAAEEAEIVARARAAGVGRLITISTRLSRFSAIRAIAAKESLMSKSTTSAFVFGAALLAAHGACLAAHAFAGHHLAEANRLRVPPEPQHETLAPKSRPVAYNRAQVIAARL